MQYPNGKKMGVHVKTPDNYARRGMSLEEDINTTNNDYLLSDLAIIHKTYTNYYC